MYQYLRLATEVSAAVPCPLLAHAVACGASVPLRAVAKAVIEGPATCLLCYRTQLAMPLSRLWMQ